MSVKTPLIAIADQLCRRLAPLSFAPPVTHVYNPLLYARAAHVRYLQRFARPGVEVLFLGMNPGPFGMAQTGVPFGEVSMVRDWMGIAEPVERPAVEHEKRPVQGFDCPRSEVSGARLWGWARDVAGTAEAFFDRFFVANYCPLAFLEESGRNRTPDKLPAAERDPLIAACDQALRETVAHMRPAMVVGIGAFAQAQAARALAGAFSGQIARILHPSPASPIANRGWAERATAELGALGVAVG